MTVQSVGFYFASSWFNASSDYAILSARLLLSIRSQPGGNSYLVVVDKSLTTYLHSFRMGIKS